MHQGNITNTSRENFEDIEGMFRTSEGHQGSCVGISRVHEYIREVFSRLGGKHDSCWGYHDYIGWCSVHWRGGGDIMICVYGGGIISTSGGVQ